MNRLTRSITVLVGAAVGIAIAPLPAFAHTGHVMNGLQGGLTHPILGPDHLLAMVTVGLLAVTRKRAAVPLAFLAAMVAGGALGMIGVPLPLTEIAIAVSIVALGGALVAGHMMRPEIAIALVAVAGVVHGHAHGAEAPDAANPATYVLGFLVATAVLHASGVAIGFGIRQRPALRAAIGTAIAAAGLGLISATV